jgi:hypothetical protein
LTAIRKHLLRVTIKNNDILTFLIAWGVDKIVHQGYNQKMLSVFRFSVGIAKQRDLMEGERINRAI